MNDTMEAFAIGRRYSNMYLHYLCIYIRIACIYIMSIDTTYFINNNLECRKLNICVGHLCMETSNDELLVDQLQLRK